jgi:hypothetical protein
MWRSASALRGGVATNRIRVPALADPLAIGTIVRVYRAEGADLVADRWLICYKRAIHTSRLVLWGQQYVPPVTTILNGA